MVLEMTARKKHPYATFILVYAALRDAVSVLRAIPYYFSDRQYKSYPDHRDFRRLKVLYTTERELPFSDDKNSGWPLYPDDRWPPAFVSEARAKAAFSGGPAEFPPRGKAGETLLIQRYKTQMDYYQRAIEQISGKKVKDRILYSVIMDREIHF